MLLTAGLTGYLPIAILIVMAIVFAVVNIVGAGVLGPKAQGRLW